MLDDKLFTILRLLSPEHFKKLHRATLSAFHQGNATAEKTYKVLSPYYPQFELSPKDIRKVYRKLFPEKDFNPRKLDKYMNVLLKTTESFLLYLRLESDDYLHEKLVNKAFTHPNLFDLFLKSQAKRHKMLDGREQKDADYWEEKTELYDRLYAHSGHEKYDVNDDTHTQLNESSDRFYMHYKMSSSIILQENEEEAELQKGDILLKEINTAIRRGDYENEALLTQYLLREERTD